ncbi:hypothetical protein INR49_031771 [Caranx melampygus]|nr:hypothetical protein INR49_031771 [Caranx melampygus]
MHSMRKGFPSRKEPRNHLTPRPVGPKNAPGAKRDGAQTDEHKVYGKEEVLVRLAGYDWVPETKLARSLRESWQQGRPGPSRDVCWLLRWDENTTGPLYCGGYYCDNTQIQRLSRKLSRCACRKSPLLHTTGQTTSASYRLMAYQSQLLRRWQPDL